MDRLTLERRQVWIYLAAIVCGLLLGSAAPGIAPRFEALLWPALALLLYATFVQVPLLHVRDAFRDRRFVLPAADFSTALKTEDMLPGRVDADRSAADRRRVDRALG